MVRWLRDGYGLPLHRDIPTHYRDENGTVIEGWLRSAPAQGHTDTIQGRKWYGDWGMDTVCPMHRDIPTHYRDENGRWLRDATVGPCPGTYRHNTRKQTASIKVDWTDFTLPVCPNLTVKKRWTYLTKCHIGVPLKFVDASRIWFKSNKQKPGILHEDANAILRESQPQFAVYLIFLAQAVQKKEANFTLLVFKLSPCSKCNLFLFG